MTYTPPDLSLDVVLHPQGITPSLALDVLLCVPHTQDVLISAGGVINNDVTASAVVAIAEPSAAYIPPALSVLVTLPQQSLSPPLPLNVVMCRDPADAEKDVRISANSIITDTITAQAAVTAKKPETVLITAVGEVSGVIASANITATEYVVGVSASANIDGELTANASMTYDVNVFRGMMRDVSSDIQQSKLAGQSGSDCFESASLNTIKIDSHTQTARVTSTNKVGLFEANVKLDTAKQSRFELSKSISTSSESLAESMQFIAGKTQLKNEVAKLAGESDWLSFEAMAYRQIERAIGADYNSLIAKRLDTTSEYSRLTGERLSSLSEFARLPFNVTRYIPPPLSQTVILAQQTSAPPDLSLNVVLCAPSSYARLTTRMVINGVINDALTGFAALTAGDAGSAYNKGVIFVTNSVSLTRTDDGRNINLFDFSVGVDSNSYCWTFSASVPLAELSKVNTANEARIGVDLTVNGHLWRFVLDGCDDTIAFGERSLSIKGKSRAMLLANPYAAHRGHKFDVPLSARQIAEAELNRGGVPSGFTLDWDLVGINGWDVPANTYSYSNRTPINSLQWIAEAAGGFINSDMSEDIIHVKELYKIPSWEWSTQTPLLTLPQSLILNRSQNRINKPTYNGVQVWGEREGSVGALIKRTGTAGSYAPPMVTSDLITTNDVARSRGIAMLSDTGDMADVSITMPLHADFGILKPATLIGVNDGEQWVGMVRGTSIKGKLSSQQTLEIEQSLSIERHFEGA